jgi:hypothetical protein
MFPFLIYILLAVELVMIGSYYMIQWKINKRRKNDILIFVIALIFGISYVFTGITCLNLPFKPFKISFDSAIAIMLLIYFFNKILGDLKKLPKK